jgi:uncharacterized membrane protein YdbT with pleckstrin-like domain
MSYVKKVLQPNETVKHESHIHWIVYLPGTIFVILALAAYFFGRLVVPQTWTSAETWPMAIGVALLVIALYLLLGAFFSRWTTELAITDRRIIFKRGFIRRHTIEMNMDKIESVDVDQSILGRMLNFGDITVRGTGTGLEPLKDIDDPIAFRNYVTAG